MKKTELAEKDKKLKEIFDKLENDFETRNSLAGEIITKLMESEINNTIKIDKLYEQLHEANEDIIRLVTEKGEENRNLNKVIMQLYENVYEIQMEVLKRIEVFEQLKDFKGIKNRDYENAPDTLDIVIEEFQKLAQFIEYRLVPISISKKTEADSDKTSNS